MREIWLDEFLESLTDEELENLIEEIQEILRRRKVRKRGGERYIHRITIFFLNRYTGACLLWICPP